MRAHLRSTSLLLLFVLLELVTAQITTSAQLTGDWQVVDREYHERTNSQAMYSAAASKGEYVVVTREFPHIGPYTIRRTTDAGGSWLVVRADSGMTLRIGGVAHPTAGLIMAIGDTTGPSSTGSPQSILHPFLLRSTDGGASWERQSFPEGFRLWSIVMVDYLSGAIVGQKFIGGGAYENAFFVTEDGGASWNRRTMQGSSLSVDRVFGRSSGSYVVTGYDRSSKSSLLLRTSNSGATWESNPIHSAIVSIDFVDSLVGWGAGGLRTGVGDTERDVLVRTTDGGVTWTTVIDSLIDFRWGLNQVAFADRDHGIAVGGYGKILRTSDGGATWRREWPPSYTVAEYIDINTVAYPVADEALAGSTSGVLRFSGRMRLSAPKIIEPSSNHAELPLEVEVAWTPVVGATWYDLEVGDTTYQYNYVNHDLFNEPYLRETGLKVTSRRVLLQPNTRYHFRVRARAAGDDWSDTSDWSVRLSTISRKAGQTLSAPSFIRPSLGDTDVPLPVTFEWTPVANATGYDLLVGTNPGLIGTNVVTLAGHPTTSYTASILNPGTTYYARVRARSSTETGNWSNINDGTLSFTTAAMVSGINDRVEQRNSLKVGPNPVDGDRATIEVSRKREGRVSITLMNVLGEQVATVFDGSLSAGGHSFTVDLSGNASGFYHVVIDDESGRVVERVLKLR